MRRKEDATRASAPEVPTVARIDALSRTLLILTVITAAMLYQRTFSYPLTEWDDPMYVADNAELSAFGWDQVKTQFRSFVAGNYHPVTMLSYAADIRLFGTDPGAMHRTNVLIHLVNILLVFLFLHRLTGEPRTAVLATMLFALHPMRVEGIAWVSGRKDLLLLFFTLLSLLSWMAWLRTRRPLHYAGALLAILLACLSKGMAVALVPTLFLIDLLWSRSIKSWPAWYEKIPFMIIALVIGVVAIKAQTTVDAITTYRHGPVDRGLIALSNIMIYLAQQTVPIGLSARYGYGALSGDALPWMRVLLALAFVGGAIWWIKAGLGRLANFAMLFFLANIFLVLEFFPIGSAIRADRYTYVSGIGWSLLVVILLDRVLQRSGVRWKHLLLTCTVAYAALFGAATHQRVPVWSSAMSVWNDILSTDPGAVDILLYRAASLRAAGRYAEAMADLDSAIAHSPPELTTPYFTRGIVFLELGEHAAALRDLETVAASGRNPPGLDANITYAKLKLGRCDEVIELTSQALARMPDAIDMLNMRALCLLRSGRHEKARMDIEHSLRLKRDYGDVWYLAALAAFARNDTTAGCDHLRRSGSLGMGDPDLRQGRDSLLARSCH